MLIMIFTEGTILMHKSGKDVSRESRVKQVIDKDKSVKDYASYLPIGNSAEKIKTWVNNGARIVYLTSRKDSKEINYIQNILDINSFPSGTLEYRRVSEKYKDVAERVLPNILIEDDCESIGGEPEMTYTHIRDSMKNKIKLIPVKEFGGIDHLPNSLTELIEI